MILFMKVVLRIWASGVTSHRQEKANLKTVDRVIRKYVHTEQAWKQHKKLKIQEVTAGTGFISLFAVLISHFYPQTVFNSTVHFCSKISSSFIGKNAQ